MKWLLVLVVAVLAFSVVATEAAPKSPKTHGRWAVVEEQATSCLVGPVRLTEQGSVSTTTTHTFDLCPAPNLAFSTLVNWRDELLDLALRVTEPDGTEHLIDHVGNVGFVEGWSTPPPLQNGIWTITVINKSGGSVAYSLSIALVITG